MEPTEDMLRSITEFPEPKDITGVHSWFGLTNQVDCFHSDWSIMESMCSLLKPAKAGEKWADRWGQKQCQAFEESRAKILAIIKGGIKSFTPGMTITLDQDRHGLPPDPEALQV